MKAFTYILSLAAFLSTTAFAGWPHDARLAKDMKILAILLGSTGGVTVYLKSELPSQLLPGCGRMKDSVSFDTKENPEARNMLAGLQAAQLTNRPVDIYVSESCIWGAWPVATYVVVK